MGIIDTLQRWSYQKWLEKLFKTWFCFQDATLEYLEY